MAKREHELYIYELNEKHPAWKYGYRYDVKVFIHPDSHRETAYYSGVGKYCRTREEATTYAESFKS